MVNALQELSKAQVGKQLNKLAPSISCCLLSCYKDDGSEEVKLAALSALGSWASRSPETVQPDVITFIASGLREKEVFRKGHLRFLRVICKNSDSLTRVHAVERTPSLSELNEILLGQEKVKQSDLSFVFRLQLMKISSTPQRFWLPLLNDSKDLVAEVLFGAAVADPQGAALVRVVVAAPSEGVATDVELLVEEVSVEGEDVLEIRGEEEANAGKKKRRKKKKGTLVCSSVDELHDQTDLLATPLGPYLPDDGERKKSTLMM